MTCGPMPPNRASRRWVGWLGLPVAVLLPMLGAGASLTAAPGAREPVAAIFAPGTPPDAVLRALAATEARLIAPGGWPSVFIVQGDSPGFIDALYGAGAWLVLSSRAAAWCQ